MSPKTKLLFVNLAVNLAVNVAAMTLARMTSGQASRLPLISGESACGECVRTVCNDGTLSSSTGHGTCSWHGGVR